MRQEIKGDKGRGLSIRLFGTLEVMVAGSPISRLRTRKGQWLLALLCLKPGTELSREWIAGCLWPDSEPERAAANLRLSLCDLRRALGSEARHLLAPTSRTLRLDIEGGMVDLAEFDAAIARGDFDSLEEAVAIYRGALLEECLEPWVDLDRRQREQACLAALESLAGAAMKSGDPTVAEGYLQRFLQMEPYRESTYVKLMQALAMRGDIAAAIRVYRDLRVLLRNELNVEPSLETAAIYQGLKEKRDRTPVQRQPELAQRKDRDDATRTALRLPRPLTEFVGREKDVARLASLVSSSRLVTLTGTGGIGKTRLAIEVAQSVVSDFLDGVFFVDLAPFTDAHLVASVISNAVGAHIDEQQDPKDTYTEAIADRIALVVLDSCEHVVPACSEAVASLLAIAPDLHVLATSRQPLGITGENQWRVDSLPLAPENAGLDAIAGSEAVELFVQRAQSVRPDFALSESNASAIAHVCRRLDGIPLALELAAARLKVLSVEQIATRLDNYFELLSNGSRTALARHRTLQAALDWSYALLSEPERLLLQRLSIFPGRFNLDAADAVCGPGLDGSVLDLIGQLADKSLLSVEEEAGEALYRLLESTRVYARARLETGVDPANLRERHAAYFLEYAECVRPLLSSPQAAEWLDRLEMRSDDFRFALTWFAEQGTVASKEAGLRLSTALWPFWHTRYDLGDSSMLASNNVWSEAVVWFEKLLAGDPPICTARAQAQVYLATLAMRREMHERAKELFENSLSICHVMGDVAMAASTLRSLASLYSASDDYARARAMLEQSLDLSRRSEDPGTIAQSLTALGTLAFQVGDIDYSRTALEEALHIQRGLGYPLGLSAALTNVGLAALAAGDWCAARAAHEESLAINEELKHVVGMAWSLDNLAEVALAANEIDRASELYRTSVGIFHSIGHRTGVADCLVGAAEICLNRNQPAVAARLLAGAKALRHRRSRVSSSDQKRFERLAEMVAARLDPAEYALETSVGERMSLDEAFRAILHQLETSTQ